MTASASLHVPLPPPRAAENYGTVLRRGGWWLIDCEPHVMIMLKRVFVKVDPAGKDGVRVRRTPEVDRHLQWFLDRYPMEMAPADAAALHRGAEEAREMARVVSSCIAGTLEPRSFRLNGELREYQKLAAELWLRGKRMLLADDLGLGKTVEAIAGLSEAALRPACVVTGVHLMRQWKAMLEKWLPGIRVHIIDGTTVYDVPTVHAKRDAKAGKLMGTGFPDVVILAYTRMQGWADYLRGRIKSVVYDEVQELRHTTTEKYKASQVLTSEVAYVLGMSATPIHNYGGEFFSVLEAIKPGALGTKEEFNREWCAGSGEGGKVKVANPRAFGLYLRESGLMLRRSREEVGRELPSLTTIPYTIPSDPAALERIRSSATELARTILRQGAVSTRGFDKMQAAGQLDMLLRQATGIAKAPAAAQHLRMIVEQGERVLAFAWHREVYGILQAQLKEYAPAMFTGTETERQKAESLRRFIEGETPILLMSLRAGAAGVDGLQHCCRTVVHIELDWSPHVHGQGTGRVHRDGQPDPVFEYFLLAEDGSDPIVSDVLGVKRAQFAPIRDPDQKLMAGHFDPDHIKRLAEGYLAARGVRL